MYVVGKPHQVFITNWTLLVLCNSLSSFSLLGGRGGGELALKGNTFIKSKHLSKHQNFLYSRYKEHVDCTYVRIKPLGEKEGNDGS